MKRATGGIVFVVLTASAFARPVSAALEVGVSVSPAEGVVGRPVEVLVRTFVPIGAEHLALPDPSIDYPVASGVWNVLYPIADYPFEVVAQHGDGTTLAIALSVDPADGSLWRGTFTPSRAGEWTVVVHNLAPGQPGAAVRMSVTAGELVPAAVLAGGGALLVGMLLGVILGRAFPRGTLVADI